MIEHFNAYAEGWRRGDLKMILGACADDFVYDDSVDGRFTKDDFPAYFEGLREGYDEASGEFVSVTDVVTEERDGELTAWCWWKDPGSSWQGAALARVGPDGVHWQKVTTFAPKPT